MSPGFKLFSFTLNYTVSMLDLTSGDYLNVFWINIFTYCMIFGIVALTVKAVIWDSVARRESIYRQIVQLMWYVRCLPFPA